MEIQEEKGEHGGVPSLKAYRTWLISVVSNKRVSDPRNPTFRLHMAKDTRVANILYLTDKLCIRATKQQSLLQTLH